MGIGLLHIYQCLLLNVLYQISVTQRLPHLRDHCQKMCIRRLIHWFQTFSNLFWLQLHKTVKLAFQNLILDIPPSSKLQTPFFGVISVSYNCYIHFDSHSQKLPFGDASFNREHNHIWRKWHLDVEWYLPSHPPGPGLLSSPLPSSFCQKCNNYKDKEKDKEITLVTERLTFFQRIL